MCKSNEISVCAKKVNVYDLKRRVQDFSDNLGKRIGQSGVDHLKGQSGN